ncbi:recombinase RecD [Clostridia bacterium]|nr:recombinase RecD [Clostridia bacterium]
MKNAVIYARYSSSAQTEQSIEGQIRVCNEYAERNGYTVIHEYIDRAMTGTNDERPDFLQMIEDASKKQFQFIIVYKLDRFARNRYDSVFYKHKLAQYGVKVLSAMEAISDTQEGRLVEGLLEMMAEMYSHDLSQKVKRGLKESALKGTFTGGNLLYGYKVIDKRIAVDEPKAAVIRYAFEQYADGKGKKAIVRELNERGLSTLKGKRFTINSFQHNLSNRKYIGENIFNGIASENSYPAIIDKAVFDRVQKRLLEHKRAPATAKAKEKYLLYGKAFCGECGTKLVGISGTSKTGDKHYYYACSKQYKEKACNKRYEKKGYLEWYVVEQTLKYVLNEKRAEIIANKVLALYANSINGKRIKEYEKQLVRIETEFDKCADMLLKAESEEVIKRINAKSKDLEIQKADLQRELTKLRLATAMQHTKADILMWLKIFTRGDMLSPDFQQRIIDTFVNSVFLFDDKLIMLFNIIEGGKQISHFEMLELLEEYERTTAETDDYDAFRDTGGVRISFVLPRQTRHMRTIDTRIADFTAFATLIVL